MAMTDKTSPAKVLNQSFAVVDSVQYQKVYNLNIFNEADDTKYEISAGPYATSTSLNAQLILENLKTDMESKVPDVTVEIIGPGLFITRPVDFVIDTPDPQLITPINSEVNNVSLLPTI